MGESFKAQLDVDGYVVVRGLFEPDEVAELREHFMTLRASGTYPEDLVGVDPSSDDPLRRYPRMSQMHRWDDKALKFLLDDRIVHLVREFLETEPLAVQTMVYFKPPGARGQALHQDNFFLKAEPGTCMAAWLALDRVDEDNGCLNVVPGSHRWPVLCVQKADTGESFTDVTVPLREEDTVVPVVMEPGDVLFFNGSLVHGSLPNITADRFRRSLVGHYIETAAREVAQYDQPVLRMDGSSFSLEVAEGGGPCGEWTDIDGERSIVMAGRHDFANAHE